MYVCVSYTYIHGYISFKKCFKYLCRLFAPELRWGRNMYMSKYLCIHIHTYVHMKFIVSADNKIYTKCSKKKPRNLLLFWLNICQIR